VLGGAAESVKDGRGARRGVRTWRESAELGSRATENGWPTAWPVGTGRHGEAVPVRAAACRGGVGAAVVGAAGGEGSARGGTEPPDGLTPGQAAGGNAGDAKRIRASGPKTCGLARGHAQIPKRSLERPYGQLPTIFASRSLGGPIVKLVRS